MDCEACGGAGHSAAECTGKPAALMDFLRDFRAGGGGTASETGWQPSGEVVLTLEQLSPKPPEAPPIGDDGPSGQAADSWPDNDAIGPEPLDGSAQPSADWGSGPPGDIGSASPGDLGSAFPGDLGSGSPGDSGSGSPGDRGSPRPGPRVHSSRSVWAGPARSGSTGAPLRPTPSGWGHHDAWSGTRIPRASRPRRRSPTVVAATVVIVITLLAAGVVYALRRQGPSYPSAWDPRAASIAAFVQNSRGLTWKHPVSVKFLTAAEFDRKLDAARSTLTGPITEQQMELERALGLTWGDADTSTPLASEGINTLAATYDASEKEVYVDGLALTPFVAAELAHALTSALEDQYFNLDRIVSGSTEHISAGSALVEGAADRVEEAYVQSLPAARQAQFQQEYQQKAAAAERVASVLPPFEADRAGFPDDFGPTLIDALYAQGGSAEVDEAFRVPPTLDGEVVNPATYEPGLPGPKVSAPPVPAGATKILPAQGFGEVPLVEMLGYEIGFSSAWRAAAGWTGDQVVGYVLEGHTCAALSVLTDNAADAGALASAGSAWSDHVPGAAVTEAGLTVNFRSCDPGPTWRPAQSGDQSFRYIAARAAFIGAFIADWHFDADGATCVADELLARLGPQQLLQDSSLPSAKTPSGRILQAAIQQAIPQCGITG